jgi:hypothetical protein
VQCGVNVILLVLLFSLATKVDQARRFNDPNDNCKVLIASDAVGMGLNL